jgi:hypothetical membrane protein
VTACLIVFGLGVMTTAVYVLLANTDWTKIGKRSDIGGGLILLVGLGLILCGAVTLLAAFLVNRSVYEDHGGA